MSRIKLNFKKKKGTWIDSKVVMDINSNDLITITKEGHAAGNIFGNNVVVYGKVDGNIIAKCSIKLHRGAVINGQVISKKIKIDPGVEGDINLNISTNLNISYFEKQIKKLKNTTDSKNITTQGYTNKISQDNSSMENKDENKVNNKSNNDTSTFTEESIQINDSSVGSFW